MATLVLPELHEQFNMIQQHFRTDAVRRAIMAGTSRTGEWLLKGDQSYTSRGDLSPKIPWWPSDLPETTNRVLLEERPQMYRDRVFEHGVLSLFEYLEADAPHVLDHAFYFDPTGSRTPAQRWDLIRTWVTDPGTKPVVRQLVFREAAEELPYGLRDIANLYGYSENAPRKVLTKLKRMAAIGLISVYAKGGYAVSTGAISHAFYHEIYLPFVENFDRGGSQ